MKYLSRKAQGTNNNKNTPTKQTSKKKKQTTLLLLRISVCRNNYMTQLNSSEYRFLLLTLAPESFPSLLLVFHVTLKPTCMEKYILYLFCFVFFFQLSNSSLASTIKSPQQKNSTFLHTCSLLQIFNAGFFKFI